MPSIVTATAVLPTAAAASHLELRDDTLVPFWM
jgi:hypothetical protein